MDEENKLNAESIKEPSVDKFDENLSIKPSSNKFSLPTIAGILLILAGVLALINWISIFTLNEATIGSFVNISQFRQLNPNITNEDILSFYTTCAIIGCVISVFLVLGGLLSIKRRFWGISLICGVIGLFSIGILFSSTLFSFIAIILLIVSRKEFH